MSRINDLIGELATAEHEHDETVKALAKRRRDEGDALAAGRRFHQKYVNARDIDSGDLINASAAFGRALAALDDPPLSTDSQTHQGVREV
jgi:hypothetical protein